MQSKCPVDNSRSASSAEPTAVISTSSCWISSIMLARCVSSSSTTSNRFTDVSMKLEIFANDSSSASFVTGFSRYASAPDFSPCCRSATPVMMCTGI